MKKDKTVKAPRTDSNYDAGRVSMAMRTIANGVKKANPVPVLQHSADSVMQFTRGVTPEAIFDQLCRPARAVAEAQVRRIHERNPQMTGAEIVEKLERRFLSSVTVSGAAAGGANFVPAVGIAAVLGDTGYLHTAAATHVYSVLKALDVELEDADHERALIFAVLLGGSSSSVVQKASNRIGGHWGKQLVKSVPQKPLTQFNKILGRNFITKYGTKQGIIVLGKAVPLGIGAAVGGSMNYMVGRGIVKATRTTFAEMLEEDARRAAIIDHLGKADIPNESELHGSDELSDELAEGGCRMGGDEADET